MWIMFFNVNSTWICNILNHDENQKIVFAPFPLTFFRIRIAYKSQSRSQSLFLRILDT